MPKLPQDVAALMIERACAQARDNFPDFRRLMRTDLIWGWWVEELAKEAGLSCSVFSERFGQKVGVPPMQYLMDWRMALAKAMLQRDAPPLEAVAVAIGYQSASAFSTAFRREVGSPPSHFARTAAG